jgi:hypothetical protein
MEASPWTSRKVIGATVEDERPRFASLSFTDAPGDLLPATITLVLAPGVESRARFSVVRQRTLGCKALVAATATAQDRSQWLLLYEAIKLSRGGWRLAGGASGRLPGSPIDGQAALLGWGWPRSLALGGFVHDGVRYVRVTSCDEVLLEDTVANNITLLLSSGSCRPPFRVELFDSRYALIDSRSWPGQGDSGLSR